MIYITEVRVEPPAKDNGHIAAVRWVKKDSPESGETSRVEMVEWLGKRKDVAFVREPDGTETPVHAVFPENRRAYIACFYDKEAKKAKKAREAKERNEGKKGKPVDTLLTLPRYGVRP